MASATAQEQKVLKIKFGTDGWRAIIAQEYTVDNVARVAEGTAQWILANSDNHSVVIGHDCRFAGELFAETTARVMCAYGIKVKLAKGFVSTPMVSLGANFYQTPLGVIITASHNPPSYNGYKLKSQAGGPASPAVIQEVEDMVPDTITVSLKPFQYYMEQGQVEYVDLEALYIDRVKAAFDLDTINHSDKILAYDAMFGAGQNVIKKLLPKAMLLHCDYNPGFNGRAPEPLHRNLQELSDLIRSNPQIAAGLATDGDADRIGMYDENGNFVDSHHILLLLIHYLHKYKGMNGKVVVAFSVSNKIKKMCELYGLEHQVTKIGFKYISEIMVKEDVLVGGEESGGIAVKGHIPERDGIWDGLILLEYMAKAGKSMTQLVQEVYDVVGPFAYDRNDLHITEELKQAILQKCQAGAYTAFGNNAIQRLEDIDGYKYYLGEDETIMIRASGTEPVLRVYAEAPTRDRVNELLEAAKATLLA
ncbi:MAG: hypothetical protein SFW35_10640 [Chitinophagales bacterium]|nr:hypothetical protein [Chitinophagales bacterium]